MHHAIRKSIENEDDAVSVSRCGTNDNEHVHVGTLVLDTLPGIRVELLAQVELYDRGEDEAEQDIKSIATP